jgi:tetratricopeptide (TPR) repeat protein
LPYPDGFMPVFLLGAGTILTGAAVGAAVRGKIGERIATKTTDAFLKAGWDAAAGPVKRLRENWARLEAPEQRTLYRALLTSHWRAVEQVAGLHARHCGVTLETKAASLPLPIALRNALDSAALPPAGIVSEATAAALRGVVAACDARVEAARQGSFEVPGAWEETLGAAYRDLTALMGQADGPVSPLAAQAWAALAAEAPDAAGIEGFQALFSQHWFEFFSFNFQTQAQEPAVAALLTGKLFHELRDAQGELLDARAILEALAGSEQRIREDIAASRADVTARLARIEASLARGVQTSQPERYINIPNMRARVLGRDLEARRLLQALREPGPAVIAVVAPPGFGKSWLFSRTMAMADAEAAQTPLAGAAVLDTHAARPVIAEFASLLGRLTGLQETSSRFESGIWEKAAPEQQTALRDRFFDFLRQAGPVWLVVENAERALLPGLSAEFRALLQAWNQKGHDAKLLLLSRQPVHPAPNGYRHLQNVEAALRDGLPPTAALELLRNALEDTRFHNAPGALLVEITRRLHCVPLALEQFAGYLKAKEAQIELTPGWVKSSDLLRLFDPEQMERFIVPLVEEHLSLLDETTRQLLWALAWAQGPIPEPGVLALATELNPDRAATLVTRLPKTNLVTRTEGKPAEGDNLVLHGLIREVIQESNGPTIPLEALAETLLNSGGRAYRKALYPPAGRLWSLSERAYRPLVEKEGRHDLANDLAGAIMNKGVALANLGRLEDAVSAYDEAIAIFRQLVEQEGRRDLANNLAKAIMNKGSSLVNLGRLEDAVSAYNEAIAILRPLVEQEGRRDLANDLAKAIMNKGSSLVNLGRLEDAVSAYDEAIAIRRPLVEQEGRRDLANALATALYNRALAFERQRTRVSALRDAREALSLWASLVAEGQKHLAGYEKRARQLVERLSREAGGDSGAA